MLKAGTVLSDPTLLPGEPVLKNDLDVLRAQAEFGSST